MSEFLNQIIELLPTSTEVYYVDYRDEMPAKALGSIIEHNGEGDAFEEMDQLLWDWDTTYSVTTTSMKPLSVLRNLKDLVPNS